MEWGRVQLAWDGCYLQGGGAEPAAGEGGVQDAMEQRNHDKQQDGVA